VSVGRFASGSISKSRAMVAWTITSIGITVAKISEVSTGIRTFDLWGINGIFSQIINGISTGVGNITSSQKDKYENNIFNHIAPTLSKYTTGGQALLLGES
jgi:hypothetical protein